ncbi:MAG: hypothetical protein AABY32_03955 [Nanoarchaeota archaeon]
MNKYCLNCKKILIESKQQRFCSRKCTRSYKVKKICVECGKDYVGRANRLYCSRSCQSLRYSKANKNKYEFTCKLCGNKFYREIKTSYKFGIKKFCSRKCANNADVKGLIKEKTRHKTQGYISIRCPEHPRAYCGRMREHILVMEKMLNRYIVNPEIVHHKNYIEDDNRKENLYLCHNKNHHCETHRKTRYLLKEFIRLKGLQQELQQFMDDRYFKLIHEE